MNQEVGEAPEWAGLGLGPESMGVVLLGTFGRLSLILKRTGRKGDSVMGCCWSEGVVRILDGVGLRVGYAWWFPRGQPD